MAENLKALTALISDAVANIDARFSELGSTFPSLHTPIPPDAPPPRADSIVLENASVLLSAATQLIATVKIPAHVRIQCDMLCEWVSAREWS